MRSAGARKTTKTSVAKKMHVTVRESDAVRITAKRDNKKVKEDCMTIGEAWDHTLSKSDMRATFRLYQQTMA